MGDLRENKKRETRERISDIATAMFFERGFDAVTVDEIAIAAKVSKMTVFNYFARKEELILDREDDLKLLFVRDAIRDKPRDQTLADTLRALITTLRKNKHPYTRVDNQTIRWWRVVAASPALEARLREMADQAIEEVAGALSRAEPDGPARLVAGMIVLLWRTAHAEAVRTFELTSSAKKANAMFLAMIERGLVAVEALSHTR